MALLRLPEALSSLPGRLRPYLLTLWKPVLAGLAMAAGTFGLYQTLVDQEGQLIYRVMTGEAARLRGEVADQVEARVLAMRKLAARWEKERWPVQEEWQREASRLLFQDLQIRAIEWVEPTRQVRWLVPTTARTPQSILDERGDEIRDRELEALLNGPDPKLSRSFPLPDAPRQILICAPMSDAGRVSGYLIGIVRARDLIDAVLASEIKDGYSVAIYEDPFLIFGPVWLESGRGGEFGNDASFQIGDLSWRLMVWPSPELLSKLSSAGPPVVLVVGFILAALCSIAVYELDRWKRRALDAEAGRVAGERSEGIGEPSGDSETAALGESAGRADAERGEAPLEAG
jgi:hypothetical protein